MKNALKTIIEYLAQHDFYYCEINNELYNSYDECGCFDSLLQQAYDRIYVSVCDLLSGYRIDPKQDLTEEAIEQLTIVVEEEAAINHFNFGQMTIREAEQVIDDRPELENLLINTYQE